jgi:hypothetical protein
MQYLGPFVAEGSPEGYLDALEQVQATGPRKLV